MIPWLTYKELWIALVTIFCLLALAVPLEWLFTKYLKREGEEEL